MTLNEREIARLMVERSKVKPRLPRGIKPDTKAPILIDVIFARWEMFYSELTGLDSDRNDPSLPHKLRLIQKNIEEDIATWENMLQFLLDNRQSFLERYITGANPVNVSIGLFASRTYFSILADYKKGRVLPGKRSTKSEDRRAHRYDANEHKKSEGFSTGYKPSWQR